MEWINIKDKMPEDCNEYLVSVRSLIDNSTKVTTSNLNPAKTGFYVDYDKSGEYPVEEVEYWMPIPPPPNHQGQGVYKF